MISVAAVSGVVAAGLTWRAWRGRRAGSPSEESEPSVDPLEPFRIALGDVVSSGGSEAWIEHGWLLREGSEKVAAILHSADVTLVVLPEPNWRVFWLEEAELELPAEAPASLMVAGEHYERSRRVPVEIEMVGRAPDPPWPSAILAEYRALRGGAVWTLGSGARVRAFQGRRVDDQDFERWGGGQATLE